MPVKLIHLMPNRLSVFTAGGDYTQPDVSFDPDLELDAFSAYLARHRKARFLALTNLAEEGFQFDSIPFLSARDRQVVVARRLGQLFQSAPMSVAISLGYEKDRRRNERILFASLNNGELLEPWMACFAANGSRLEGVHSVALLGPQIIEATGAQHERRFLLTMHGDILRQSYFEGSALRFSRLSRLTDSSIAGLAKAFQTEAGRLYQYLLSQRALTRGKPVTVLLVAASEARAAVEEISESNDILDFQFVDAAALGQRLHFRHGLVGSNVDPLFLHLLATRPPRQQFAPPALRRPYQLWRAGRILYAGAAGVLGLTLAIAAGFAIDIGGKQAAATAEREAAAAADARYAQLSGAFPKLPISNDRLRAIVADFSRVEQAGRDPRPVLVALSQGLDRTPEIAIDRLFWRAPPLSAPPAAVASTAPARTNPVTGSPPERAERLEIHGRISRQPDDTPRQVLDRFNGFVDQLNSAPGLSVRVDQNPYDVGSEMAIKSRDDVAGGNRSRPFALTLSVAGRS